MSLAALDFLNRWFIRECLNALLRPVWLRSRESSGADGAIRARADLRFIRLLDACNCWPFGVIADEFGLWILDHDQMERERERAYMEGDF